MPNQRTKDLNQKIMDYQVKMKKGKRCLENDEAHHATRRRSLIIPFLYFASRSINYA